MQTQQIDKRLFIDFPADLYNRFLASKFRRESKTDAEGIRAALKRILDQEQECQEKSSQ